ncbi:hypothetical protein PFBG_02329 [Plasmodium falciparum 7G8]|uniref:Rifin n=1 Tax=Plasmodium falciparum (isolate 7G8) TaxID=57266 RepID=W7FG97_PLAF8|nr:hypothetical protein PFBG_02329 [Plasmodium falciparum 7G8]
MKVHYINILLFALPLNILEHNKNEPHTTPNHTQTTRSLCECKLYSPTNYDSDPQMKEVMDNFNKQTQQRFHEYDEKMQSKRIQCKDRCDKEIQNIILKDKLEKQMAEQLTTLETKIDTDDIPTCICEKSLEDKMEKECLKCAQNLGGIVAPSTGVLGEIAALAVNAWKTEAIKAAKAAAAKAASDAATQAGIEAVSLKIEQFLTHFARDRTFVDLTPIVNESTYKNSSALVESARKLINDSYKIAGINRTTSFQNTALNEGQLYVGNFAKDGATAYQTTLTTKTVEFEAAKVGALSF